MPTYLFSVQSTYQVQANNKEEALDLLGTDSLEVILKDSDTLLVDEW